jgi:hypothetical protein
MKEAVWLKPQAVAQIEFLECAGAIICGTPCSLDCETIKTT